MVQLSEASVAVCCLWIATLDLIVIHILLTTFGSAHQFLYAEVAITEYTTVLISHTTESLSAKHTITLNIITLVLLHVALPLFVS